MKLERSNFSFVELQAGSVSVLLRSNERDPLCAIVPSTHWQQQNVHLEALGKRERNRDRASLARQIWSLLVHGLYNTRPQLTQDNLDMTVDGPLSPSWQLRSSSA